MIEATCAACGTQNRIAEADVPVGAKFVTCQSCKSRVALPTKAGGVVVPKVPAIPPKAPPPIPAAPKAVDLADLPAPKRNSPLAGADASKPAPKSPFAGLDAELPAPKASAKPVAQALDL